MQADVFQALQQWYLAECNGDWEHSYGVHIETLDNPGWMLKVDLRDTSLAERSFQTAIREHERDWFHCHRSDDQFIAAGGPLMLHELVSIFLTWVQTPEPATP
jgi:hypothetical protein